MTIVRDLEITGDLHQSCVGAVKWTKTRMNLGKA